MSKQSKQLAAVLLVCAGLSQSDYLYSAYAPITEHYDLNGNIDQRIDGSGATTYSYDALDRLQSEAGPNQTQTITYDGNGNRKSDATGSYTYLSNSNKLNTAPNQTISLDAAGNIIGNGVYTFTYNNANQLSQVNRGASIVANYFYNYRGLRSRKQVGSVITLFHYDQAGHLIAETRNGSLLTTYIWRDDTPYAIIDSSSGQDQVWYIEVDSNNTPRVVRDQNGRVIWTWYSDAFGSTYPNEDPDGDGVITRINLRFAGQYYDMETGLVYNEAR